MAWPRFKKSRSSVPPGTQGRDGVQATVTPAPGPNPAKGAKQNTGVSGTRHSVAEEPAPVRYADSGVDDVSPDYDDAPTLDDGIAILEGVVTTAVPEDDPDPGYLEAPQPRWNEQFADPPQPVTTAAKGNSPASAEPPVSVTPPAWDSAGGRLSIRDLPPDVRVRLWRTRAIIVIVVGVVFTIVANWEVGLSLAIVVRVIMGIPIAGSVPLFLVGVALYLFFTTAVGILLGTIARSMPQLGLLYIMIALPMNLLSGANTPVESMPLFLRTVMQAVPATHFVSFAQAILYRGAGLDVVWPQFLAVTLIGGLCFVAALLRFRRITAQAM